jgi:transposase
MIQVEQKETIRILYFIKRHSVRQIAKELGHSRKTIKKAITDAAAPQYRLTAGRPSLVMGPYLDMIKTWLEVDKSRPAKQRHTAHRIYARLVNECGFTGAERTVREHVAKLRPTFAEMFIPLEFDPGTDAQCDWDVAQVIIAGKLINAQVLA